MFKKIAKIAGIVLIVIGVLGFIPGFTYKNHLLGIFHVNATHNFIHLASGVIAYLSRANTRACQFFFQIFGILYAATGLMGFGYGSRDILGVVANNMADSWLHLILGMLFLYIGFLYRPKNRPLA